jgi:hypothetical protein
VIQRMPGYRQHLEAEAVDSHAIAITDHDVDAVDAGIVRAVHGALIGALQGVDTADMVEMMVCQENAAQVHAELGEAPAYGLRVTGVDDEGAIAMPQ